MVSGLVGQGLVLQNNAGDPVSVNMNGAFTFPTSLSNGAAYAVTVKVQPSTPTQSCTVSNGTGLVANARVSNVGVVCTTTRFTIGGTVMGLSGTGLVLRNSAADDLTVSVDGAFTFATSVASGTTYAVTVRTQPNAPVQSCSVSGGSGTVGSGNVTGVVVNCATDTFVIGGTIAGLDGTVILERNGASSLSLNANGTFAFALPVASGASYAVTVASQPALPAQTCVVAGGTGIVGNANVASVVVTCTTRTFATGGTVAGLGAGATLILRNNGGDSLSVTSNGPFEFPTPVASALPYEVTVQTQPTSPTQVCTIVDGAGTIGSDPVTNVAITCVSTPFTIGGAVVGLAPGATVVLRNNGADTLSVTHDGAFTFPLPVISGSAYSVTVSTQPSAPLQTCAVSGGSGIVGSQNVTGVVVNCTTNTFAVGGTISGLNGAVVLRNNGGDDLTVNANGSFAFATPLPGGSTYVVTVQTQPSAPSQTCTLTAGSGTVTDASIISIAVTCVTNSYTVGGALSGLAVGATVVLQDNGGNDLSLTGNGPFVFATPVASGASYSVTVLTQPSSPVQVCVAASASGTVGGADISAVTVVCTTTTFTVGGNVTGLLGAGLVLRNNGGDSLPIAADGGFVFSTPVDSGAPYAVTVETQPSGPSQTCAVSAGSGTVAAANGTTVVVTCTTDTRTVGGTVSALTGSGLVLRNNDGDDLTISANGAFTFATPIAIGLGYAVTVFTQPPSPAQTCTLTGGAGIIGADNITDVAVTCTGNVPPNTGTGSDGVLDVSGSVVINTVSSTAAGTSGETTLMVGSSTGFAIGQSILIHQSQGTNAGDWERAAVAAVAGAVLTLVQPLQHSYTSTGTNNHAQAVVAPQYTDVTVPAGQSLAAPAWNGTTGGILVFNASGTVTVAGTMTMTGRGFRGGIGNSNDTGSVTFKTQGESYSGVGATGLTTNVANAGGGNGGAKQGGCEGGGGGGGGYAAAGTNGGAHVTCFPLIQGGVGGGAYGDAALATIFFGSGGGSGGYTVDAALGRGGDGGGIVMVFANQVTITSSIDARGTDGTVEFGDYGGGGGAAGGSIYLSSVQPIVGFGNVTVAGGTGGLANGRMEVGGNGAPGRAVAVP